ncbi:MAG: glycerophosphodiester phosphodiesterase [Chitinophagaceae bacterium]
MKQLLALLLLCVSFFSSCKKTYEVPVLNTNSWSLFNDPSAQPIQSTARTAMEGIYQLSAADGFFGGSLALKWSHVIKNNDTVFHVSGFFQKDIAYFICEGKLLKDSILLNGYWRKMVSTETGLIHLVIAAGEGASLLLSNNPVINKGSVIVHGLYGNGGDEPGNSIAFAYERKLNNSLPGFQIAAHRSGGRNSDLLPVSENSVAMILKTPEFGSTGIEVDVRYTKDGVPILYHDNTLNLRVVQKSGLVGPIENYTYDQLSTFVRLIHGEKIPTLREALDAVVYQTDLSFVWLDTKYTGSIAPVHAIQQEYIQKAAAIGRKLNIVIGLPEPDQYEQFKQLPDYANTPSLCELGLSESNAINARIWAPRFTEGTQNELVDQAHAAGRKVYVWTVDVPEFIEEFINDGHFDGILSNFPSCVAYNYYAHQ